MTKEDRVIVKNEVKTLENIKPYSYDAYISFLKDLIEKHPFSYFSLVKGQRFKILWNDICEKTKFLDTYFSPNAATRVFYYINKLNDIKRCDTDGKVIAKDISPVKHTSSYFFCCNRCAQLHESTVAKTKATKLKNHGDPNWNNMEKNRATCQSHYGVECSWQAKEVKEKCKQSIRKHYGVDHQMHSQEVKDAMKARYKEAHGVEYSFQDPEVQVKIKAKNREKLGVDWPMQSKELHKIMHEHSALTQTSNFFNDKLSKDPRYEALFTLDEWLAHGGHDSQYEFLWRCKKCGKEFRSRIMWGAATYVRCYECYPVMRDTSNFEKEIADYIRSLGKFDVLNHVAETKQIIPPKEIDIVVKDMSGKILLGIEADGLYWHSAANNVGKSYHLDKTEMCNDKGIQLIHIFEDEWTLKKDIVKSRLCSLLGMHKNKTYARCCEIKEVQSKDARAFFDTNHLQGYNNI